MTAFLVIFRRFPTTIRRFPKIFQNCFEDQTNVSEHFPRIPKISEDVRKFLKDCPKTFEEDPRMFQWYTNEFKDNLRDKLYMWGYPIVFMICYHSVYHWQGRGRRLLKFVSGSSNKKWRHIRFKLGRAARFTKRKNGVSICPDFLLFATHQARLLSNWGWEDVAGTFLQLWN